MFPTVFGQVKHGDQGPKGSSKRWEFLTESHGLGIQFASNCLDTSAAKRVRSGVGKSIPCWKKNMSPIQKLQRGKWCLIFPRFEPLRCLGLALQLPNPSKTSSRCCRINELAMAHTKMSQGPAFYLHCFFPKTLFRCFLGPEVVCHPAQGLVSARIPGAWSWQARKKYAHAIPQHSYHNTKCHSIKYHPTQYQAIKPYHTYITYRTMTWDSIP